MFGPIGMPELIIIFVIALIVFGPRKLPELGKSLGRSLAEFKRASNDLRSTLEQEIRIEETIPKDNKTDSSTTTDSSATKSDADDSAGKEAPKETDSTKDVKESST